MSTHQAIRLVETENVSVQTVYSKYIYIYIYIYRWKSCRSPDDEIDPLVSPLTLSAAMKVDSSFIPSLVPIMQCAFSASLLQVRLANHVQCMGNGMSCFSNIYGWGSEHRKRR